MIISFTNILIMITIKHIKGIFKFKYYIKNENNIKLTNIY